MATYVPTMPPLDGKDLRKMAEWVHRELRAIGSAVSDSSDEIHYMTPYAADGSLSANISANWKCANARWIRCSTSNTVSIGGIAYKQPKRTFTFMNVGTGVLAFKNEDAGSSASFRLALPSALYQISAGHAVTFVYDPSSTRHRPVSRT
jgi:hypothetical protein